MDEMTDIQQKISIVCDACKTFLLKKNVNYGNSALQPIHVFSQLDAEAGLRVRLDDKLARIKNHPESTRKNDIVDIIGYLVLKCVKENWTDFSDLVD